MKRNQWKCWSWVARAGTKRWSISSACFVINCHISTLSCITNKKNLINLVMYVYLLQGSSLLGSSLAYKDLLFNEISCCDFGWSLISISIYFHTNVTFLWRIPCVAVFMHMLFSRMSNRRRHLSPIIWLWYVSFPKVG